MFKELGIVFCTMSLCLVQDIVTVPLRSNNDQPISQWSGQINGFDIDHNYVPGYGTGNGNTGNGSNGMGSGSNGMGNGSNGMGNGSNGMGNGSNGMGNGSNGMGNESSFSSGWINGFSNGANNGMGSVSNSSSGWINGFTNESNNGTGNGSNSGGGWGNGFTNGMGSNNVMSDEQWSNGFGGMSWSNHTNATFGSIQNQTNGYPGSGYPSMYYQQYSQSFVMPTPATVEDMQNVTPPNPNSYTGQIQNHAGNMGNINRPTGIQFQGCGPQSSGSTVSSETESIPVTQASTDETNKTQDGKGRMLPSKITSNKKPKKH